MKPFPDQEPALEIILLEEPAAPVECRELPWGYPAPDPGAHRRVAEYEYPDWRLTRLSEYTITGPCTVHDEECMEFRDRELRPDGQLVRERYGYGAIREGLAHWFGWWNMADELKFYTYKDKDFAWDWGPPTPTCIVDTGHFRWTAENRVETVVTVVPAGIVNPIGAGMWLIRLGPVERRCLRFVDVHEPAKDPSREAHVFVDGFLSLEGKVLLTRHYYWSERQMWNWKAPAREHLKDAPTMTCDDITYYLWYDRVSEEMLG